MPNQPFTPEQLKEAHSLIASDIGKKGAEARIKKFREDGSLSHRMSTIAKLPRKKRRKVLDNN